MIAVVWAATAAAGPVLAVADLRDQTGDPALASLGPGVSALLVSRFVQVDGLKVVERARLDAVITELNLGKIGIVDPQTAIEAGRVLGATHLAFGDLLVLDPKSFTVHLRVVDTRSGQVVVADEQHMPRDGGANALGELLDALAGRVATGLAVAPAPAADPRAVRELAALLALTPNTAPNLAWRPDALVRDRAYDLLPPPTRDQWTLETMSGSMVPASAFARMAGRDDVLATIETTKTTNDRRMWRQIALGGAITAGGVGAVIARDPDAGGFGLLAVGTLALCLGPALSLTGPVVRWNRNLGAERPGRYWTPEQADAEIDAYNQGLTR